MEIIQSLTTSLLTPMVLAFVLGIASTSLKSDLKFQEGLYSGLTIYLLLAIGIKGGVKFSSSHILEFYKPAIVALAMCCLISTVAFLILNKIVTFNSINARRSPRTTDPYRQLPLGRAQLSTLDEHQL